MSSVKDVSAPSAVTSEIKLVLRESTISDVSAPKAVTSEIELLPRRRDERDISEPKAVTSEIELPVRESPVSDVSEPKAVMSEIEFKARSRSVKDVSAPKTVTSEIVPLERVNERRFTACSNPLNAATWLQASSRTDAMSSCVIASPALLPRASSTASRKAASLIVTAVDGEAANWMVVCAAGPSPSALVARRRK